MKNKKDTQEVLKLLRWLLSGKITVLIYEII